HLFPIGETALKISKMDDKIRKGKKRKAREPNTMEKIIFESKVVLLNEIKTPERFVLEAGKVREYLRNYQNNNFVDLKDYIKQVTESAKALGLSGGGKSEIDLKLEDMRQGRDLDNRRIDLEEKKWLYEQENSGKTMEQVTNLIKTVGEGPIGKAIENMGSGVGERLKTGKNNNSPQLIKIQCPKCYGQFSVNPALQTVSCTHCGAVLQSTPPTPQSQPELPPVTQEPQQQQIDAQQTQEPPQQEPSNVQATDQAPAQ
ncbi:zinc-ribbon domain-containing protein, partial [Candidatus Bathyarchaeota archaeon]|nr:zinc-ribbon domain-containing protein [Candidatus Bathyarchaeota archaeon]